MQIGLCANSATLAQLTSPQAAPGADFLEGFVQEWFQPETPDAARVSPATALHARGFSLPAANRFLPPDLKVSGPNVDYARLDRFAATAFRRAKEHGTTLIVFGSAGARQVPEGFSHATAFEQYVDVLRQCGPLAEENGVTLLVEPLNRCECNLVNTVREGAEAVRRANTSGVKLLVDFFHMARNGESPDDLLKVGPLIRHAHVAENRDRAAPGTHGENFRPFYRALRRTGYNGLLTIEADWTDFLAEAGPSIAALRGQLSDAGY
jgi:sugar phosphate isomerase/epimerase